MWEQISGKSQELVEVKQEKRDKEQKLSDLKADTFGTDSEEAEQKARSFFQEVGMESGNGRTQEIDETREELAEIEETIEQLEETILQELTDLKFPFNETIEQREDEIAFPFSKELPQETVEVITDVVRNGMNNGVVELRTEEVVAHVEDVDTAIDEVEKFATKLREAARHELNIDDYVDKLAERDIKIRRMLYELYQVDKALEKRELEERTGVGSGGLRGVLYHVFDNDPYLMKEDQAYRLSEIGRDVMERFLEQHGEPPKPETEDESDDPEESDETDEADNEPNQATLNESGETNE
jgi:hypothetical protein